MPFLLGYQICTMLPGEKNKERSILNNHFFDRNLSNPFEKLKPVIPPTYMATEQPCGICLEPGKIEALKMLDLQTKSAMKLV